MKRLLYVEIGLCDICDVEILEGEFSDWDLEVVAQNMADKLYMNHIKLITAEEEYGYDFHNSWGWEDLIIKPEYADLPENELLYIYDDKGYNFFVKNYCVEEE
jgi:hypothetical protein